MSGEDGTRACAPLSIRTRRRLLRDLLRRADAGDARAAEALVRLSLDAERQAREAEKSHGA